MKTILDIISQPEFGIQGKTVTAADIAQMNEELSQFGLPEIPPEYQTFLLQCNGISHDGRCLWGIDTAKHFMYDILGENLMSPPPNPDETLLLGNTSGTFLAWETSTKRYSIIDKSSFMVLHNFSNFTDALKYILKIND